MSSRLDKLEARARALRTRGAAPVLIVPLETGCVRMTVAEYNVAGGIQALPFWTNPDALNLKAAKALLDAVPSVDMADICRQTKPRRKPPADAPTPPERNHNLI